MTRRIVIRPKASVDLDEQFAYIADSNFDAALSFFDATRQTFSQLAQLPGIGSVYNVKNMILPAYHIVQTFMSEINLSSIYV